VNSGIMDNAIQWHDSTLLLSDPLIAWEAVNTTDPAMVRGQLWGAAVFSGSQAGEPT
jgi:hypothetical protein